ncbi:MAG: zinc ribbon domain-containing protein [Halobacteriales archaeon]
MRDHSTNAESPEDEPSPRFVECPDCGAKAPTGWRYCRSCNANLDDVPAFEASSPELDLGDGETSGCPKCGHDGAEIDEMATTGTGASKLFDIQDRRFQVVSCTDCGYSELYRDQDADVILDLFIG